MTVFSPATHLLRVFFILFFSALSSDPGRPSPSSHFVSFDSLRPRRKSAYLYLQDPAYAKRPQRRGKPEKRLDFRCFLPKKTHETMTIVKCTGAFTLIRRIFHPPAPVFGPGFRPEQPPGPDRLPLFHSGRLRPHVGCLPLRIMRAPAASSEDGVRERSVRRRA